MRVYFAAHLTVVVLGWSVVAVLGAEPTGKTAQPGIRFEATTYDFGTVTAGEVVEHEFVFTNTGTAALEILDVRPSCGCTTAGGWDKRVGPGETGVIPLQLKSASFEGKITKPITITSNDPEQPSLALRITGTVWRPIKIMPSTLVFRLTSEDQSAVKQTARILSEIEEPIELSGLECTNKAFKVELETVRPGKEFALHVTAQPPFQTSPTIAAVQLKTSYKSMPTLSARAYVLVEEAVVVAPNYVMVPAGPLTNSVRSVLSVRNNGKEPLELSEPALNAPKATVRLKTLQPGRYFSIMVDFPVGFELGEEPVQLTLKSNHPKHPSITVPVLRAKPGAAIPGRPVLTRPVEQ